MPISADEFLEMVKFTSKTVTKKGTLHKERYSMPCSAQTVMVRKGMEMAL